MIAHEEVDRPLPVPLVAHQCPKCLRRVQRLSREPGISGIDWLLIVPTRELRMFDCQVEVVLECPKGR